MNHPINCLLTWVVSKVRIYQHAQAEVGKSGCLQPVTFTTVAICSADTVLLGYTVAPCSRLLREHYRYISPNSLLHFYKKIKYYFLVENLKHSKNT